MLQNSHLSFVKNSIGMYLSIFWVTGGMVTMKQMNQDLHSPICIDGLRGIQRSGKFTVRNWWNPEVLRKKKQRKWKMNSSSISTTVWRNRSNRKRPLLLHFWKASGLESGERKKRILKNLRKQECPERNL